MTRIVAIILATPFAIVWRAYVITHLWRWFIEPFGLPAIGIAWAAGLSLLAAFLTHELNETPAKDGVEIVARFFLMPAFALGLGAIFASFMP